MAHMTQAVVVRYNEESTRKISNPEHYTVVHAVKKHHGRRLAEERAAEARRVASGRFNSIRGLEKLR